MGLNDKLKLAATATVVENLLTEGSKFTLASPKTQRRRKYVATRRLKELQPKPQPQLHTENTEKKVEPVSQKTPDPHTGRVVNRHRKYHKT